ncbi:hypothetical protein PENTCL1PPCAC_24243, partial [Pristionchus entomophagus]
GDSGRMQQVGCCGQGDVVETSGGTGRVPFRIEESRSAVDEGDQRSDREKRQCRLGCDQFDSGCSCSAR